VSDFHIPDDAWVNVLGLWWSAASDGYKVGEMVARKGWYCLSYWDGDNDYRIIASSFHSREEAIVYWYKTEYRRPLNPVEVDF
jgi:hypothetical protein